MAEPGRRAVGPPRPAVAADQPAVEDVVQAAYAKYLSRMDRPPGPMLRGYTEPITAGRVWVVGQPVRGLIELDVHGDALLIENVAVHPSAQGRGLGRLLLEFAEQRAVRCGLHRLELYTHELMVENLALYARRGYREVARRVDDGYRRVFLEKALP